MAIVKTTNKGVTKIEEQLKRLKAQEAELKAQLKAEQEAAVVAVGEVARSNEYKLPNDLLGQLSDLGLSDLDKQAAELDAKIAKLCKKRNTIVNTANKKVGELITANIEKLPENLRKKVEALVGIEGESEDVVEQLELVAVSEQQEVA